MNVPQALEPLEHKTKADVMDVGSPATILDMIARASADAAVDVNKVERLMGMYERLVARRAEASFNIAMNEVQAETRAVVADSDNTQTKSKYASYFALDRVLRPIYTRHGLSLSFDSGEGAPENFVRVLCYVGHKEGHTRTYRADMPADGKGAKGGDVMTKTHATGSAFTYGQRYLLKLIFNVAISEDDDDGNAAGYSELINDQQKAEVVDLLRKTGSNVKAFLNYMKIASVDEMPAAKFANAKAALEKKRKAKQMSDEAN
jgi:ERF superfamily